MEEFYHCPDPALPNTSRFLKELFEAFPFPLSDLFFCLLRVPLIIFDDGDFLILQRSPSKNKKRDTNLRTFYFLPRGSRTQAR